MSLIDLLSTDKNNVSINNFSENEIYLAKIYFEEELLSVDSYLHYCENRFDYDSLSTQEKDDIKKDIIEYTYKFKYYNDILKILYKK
uniref:Uncharacterized protein n=1 Tax=viral metagenome TaxID=1070528 RepID=A0A6C0AE92_9ZZZZ